MFPKEARHPGSEARTKDCASLASLPAFTSQPQGALQLDVPALLYKHRQ